MVVIDGVALMMCSHGQEGPVRRCLKLFADSVGESYGLGYPMRVLLEAVSKITYHA